MARNVQDLLQIIKALRHQGIVLSSVSEGISTYSVNGTFTIQMMGVVAELERNTIIDNVKLRMAQRSRQGRWNGGICLGYKSEVVGDDSGETRLVIMPEETDIVRKIFNSYASGKGLRAIANSLNKERYQTKRGNSFNTSAIKEIIRNPLYIGKIRFNRYKNWSEHRRKGKSENVILADYYTRAMG